jgi:hypothetical protein
MFFYLQKKDSKYSYQQQKFIGINNAGSRIVSLSIFSPCKRLWQYWLSSGISKTAKV